MSASFFCKRPAHLPGLPSLLGNFFLFSYLISICQNRLIAAFGISKGACIVSQSCSWWYNDDEMLEVPENREYSQVAFVWRMCTCMGCGQACLVDQGLRVLTDLLAAPQLQQAQMTWPLTDNDVADV